MNDDTDYNLLLAEACSDDPAGMERLAGRVRERLYPYILRVTFNPDATEDILQETLMAMIGGVRSLRDRRRFWPWMYRIAWSKIQDAFRQKRVQSSMKDSLLQGRFDKSAGRDEYTSVLEAKVREETLEQISRAVNGLSRPHRDVVHLRCFEQLPYTEIASRTNTTPERVRVQFHRAKESLRAQLACPV